MHNIARMQQQMINNQLALVATQQRSFGGKKKKSKKTDDEPSEYEEEATVEEPTYEPTPLAEDKPDFSAATASQPPQEVSSDLFGAFSLGSVN